MNVLAGAVWNELLKLMLKKRLLAVMVIQTTLFMVVGGFALAHPNHYIQGNEWRSIVNAEIKALQAPSPTLSAIQVASDTNRTAFLHFELVHNASQTLSGLPGIATSNVSGPIMVIIVVLMVVMGADIVNGELADGTAKVLLLSQLGRGRILLSKSVALIALGLLISFYWTLFGTVLDVAIYHGNLGDWSQGVLVGVQARQGMVDLARLTVWPIWLYLTVGFSLNLISFSVASILIVAVSAVLRSPVTTSGTLLVAMVGGVLAQQFFPWTGWRYMPFVNFDLVSHLVGFFPIAGVSLWESLLVLIGWAVIAGGAATAYFVRRDFGI